MDLNTQGLSHVKGEHTTLYSTIYSISFGHNAIPPTSFNSHISSNPDTPSPDNSPETMLNHLNATMAQPSPLSYQPDSNQGNTTNSDMRRGEGPFMTNGLLQESLNSSDTTKSESLTTTMFNLESLNEGRPDWTRGHAILTDNQSHYSLILTLTSWSETLIVLYLFLKMGAQAKDHKSKRLNQWVILYMRPITVMDHVW